ncbi:H-NS histone family protein [Craterilacuibacter sinensis]|uniref:H-NS histone family protein n=1 Tax=Craterilacuibacter sinensis TaxID=2686017 RepID=A0A845BVV6_9NEIS|nr:H-NS histone family protein [Craterilacuibacter sinensis]MXR36643.1 H-NS histone family protein [Craterilacuibacter sinensis]RQW22320.1 H-NS histone family protein [Rhodobacteraceae bacterium CH30]
MQIETLSYPELLQLKSDVESEIAKREQEEKSKARKQILEIARTYGLSVEEVLSKSVSVRKPVEAKYCHPEHPDMTWTGRGRKPVWVVELLAAGKTLADLAI